MLNLSIPLKKIRALKTYAHSLQNTKWKSNESIQSGLQSVKGHCEYLTEVQVEENDPTKISLCGRIER